MSDEITCPRCSRSVQSQKRYCDHCGVDLGLAAVLAELEVRSPLEVPSGVPMAPEILVPRIGEYMIERGMLENEELECALSYQRQREVSGEPILLGQALLELNLTNRETLDQVVTTQILELQTALSQANQSLQKRVEERTRELRSALEHLAELNQLKSNFIANISHELRTPLTHIKGYLDILSEEGLGPLTEAQADALKVLLHAENRLERLIDDLIQFSLASRGELSINLQDIELEKLIKSTLNRSSLKAKSKGILLGSRLPEKIPQVRADEDKIGWVLLQLLDNAFKFTPDGGQVKIQVTVENSLVTISVTDSGIGIPEDRIAEIFEPFHQLDGSTTRRYAGTGLGLALVRRIVEAHGTQVRVKSVIHKGSRFEFSLPAVRSKQKQKTKTKDDE